MGGNNFKFALSSLLFVLLFTTKLTFAQDYLLPKNIVPVHYDLTIRPYIDNLDASNTEKYLTADGTVVITINCSEGTNNITIHIENSIIDVISKSLADSNGNSILLNETVIIDEKNDFYTIFLAEGELISNTQYELTIVYNVKMKNAGITGLYLDHYYPNNDRNNKRYLSTTLFAPNAARKAYPCFDEPNLRASFEVKLVRRDGFRSLTNMQLNTTTVHPDDAGWNIDTFRKSPPMSTYIVAFIVCDFEYAEAKLDGLTSRVYATSDFIKAGYGNYSANLNARVLYFFQNYLNQSYMLDEFGKFDSVAVPQFNYNAMENWALVTYKEPVLLYHSTETSELEKTKIDYVVSHELAHQFFGNLVNFESWQNIWLSEGFATFYGYVGFHYASPEYEVWKLFIPDSLQIALEVDGSSRTHAIHHMPLENDDIDGVYTRIVYDKAASILRMIESVITKEVFHTGIKNYLENNKWNGANQDFVFNALQASYDNSIINNENQIEKLQLLPTDLNVIYKSWTDKSGFPIVNVNLGVNTITLSQEQFTNKSSPATWWIPIWVNTEKGDLKEIYWMNNTKIPLTIPLNLIKKDEGMPILVNPLALGYYRVLYTEELEERIINHFSTINPEAKSQILDDYFKFAFSSDSSSDTGNNYRNISKALQMTKTFDSETEYIVWRTLLDHNMPTLYNRLYDSNIFNNYFSTKVHGALSKIGYGFEPIKGEGKVNKLLRRLLFEYSTKFGQTFTFLNLNSINSISQWMNDDKNLIDPNVQAEVYCSRFNTGADSEIVYNFFIKKYEDEFSKVQRLRYLKGISCSTSSVIILKALDFASDNTTTSTIWTEDRVGLIQNVARNPFARKILLTHIDENLSKYLSEDMFSQNNVANFISLASTYMKTEEEKNTLIAFRSKHEEQLNEVLGSLLTSITDIENNINWMEKYKGEIERTLDQLTQKSGSIKLLSWSIPFYTFVVFLVIGQ